MFTNKYVSAANGILIDNDAMWGNPQLDPSLNQPSLTIDLYEFFNEEFIDDEFVLTEEVLAVAFDFAWATSAGSPSNPRISSFGISACATTTATFMSSASPSASRFLTV